MPKLSMDSTAEGRKMRTGRQHMHITRGWWRGGHSRWIRTTSSNGSHTTRQECAELNTSTSISSKAGLWSPYSSQLRDRCKSWMRNCSLALVRNKHAKGKERQRDDERKRDPNFPFSIAITMSEHIRGNEEKNELSYSHKKHNKASNQKKNERAGKDQGRGSRHVQRQ